jgi:prephenate dehydrogenase
MERAGLSDLTIAVAGLGLMGGSFALALRDRCKRLLAVDPDEATRRLAVASGIVDAIAADPERVLPEADLVVLAAPVLHCLDLLDRLPGLHPGSPVVMDLASTKSEVAAAYRRLPGRFDPLPAHPMCGKEVGGLENAEAGLFAGSVLVFTPVERTSARARRLGEEISSAVGAQALWLDPETHDAWAARTSHAPYLLAAALAAATPLESAALTGPGFRSTARLAGSDPEMMADVLLTNRAEIRNGLADLRRELDRLADTLNHGERETIRRALSNVRSKYRLLLSGKTNQATR